MQASPGSRGAPCKISFQQRHRAIGVHNSQAWSLQWHATAPHAGRDRPHAAGRTGAELAWSHLLTEAFRPGATAPGHRWEDR